YLTRRLVDVAQDCIITTDDCGTSGGIAVRAIIDAGTVVASLESRILGRTTAEDVRDPSSHKVIMPNGTLLDVPEVETIKAARVLIGEGDQIKRGQRIAEWDPYTRPILTEVEGMVGFEDLVEGQSMSETLDESTGIAKRVVTDWRTGSGRGQQELRPSMVIKKDNKILKLSRGGEARYTLAA